MQNQVVEMTPQHLEGEKVYALMAPGFYWVQWWGTWQPAQYKNGVFVMLGIDSAFSPTHSKLKIGPKLNLPVTLKETVQ